MGNIKGGGWGGGEPAVKEGSYPHLPSVGGDDMGDWLSRYEKADAKRNAEEQLQMAEGVEARKAADDMGDWLSRYGKADAERNAEEQLQMAEGVEARKAAEVAVLLARCDATVQSVEKATKERPELFLIEMLFGVCVGSSGPVELMPELMLAARKHGHGLTVDEVLATLRKAERYALAVYQRRFGASCAASVTPAEWERRRRSRAARRLRTLAEWGRRRTEWETQHGRPFPDPYAEAAREIAEAAHGGP